MTAHLDFAGINDAAMASLPALLARWLSDGRIEGREYTARNPRRADRHNGSFKVNLDTGKWADFATDDRGGDPVSLLAYLEGCLQSEAARRLAEDLALANVHCDTTHPQHRPLPSEPPSVPKGDDDRRNLDLARRLWREAIPAADSPIKTYLQGRGLILPAGAPIKFHPSCPRGPERLPAMLALMTTADGNEPVGVHRTFIQPNGSGKANGNAKMMLGPAAGAVVRLSPDDDVTLGLGIAEGIETSLAILGIGWAPVWACLSAGGIAKFPVLPGVEALTIFNDHDDAGQRAARDCAERWATAGKEARIITPRHPGTDWNNAGGAI